MTPSDSRSMDRFAAIFSGVLISSLGAMFYNLLPLFLGTAQDYRELSDRAVGALSSSFYVGFTLATVTAFFWIRRWSWRRVTGLAIPIAAVAMLMAGYVQSYVLMVTGILIAGGAFSAIYGIGTTLLGDTSQPARWYGLKIACEAGIGVVMLLILPGFVIAKWGFEGMMAAMAATLLLLAPFLFWMPSSGTKKEDLPGEGPSISLLPLVRVSLWLGLAGVMIFLFSTTMIWAFVERMANEAGFDPVATGNVLSLTLVFAVAGSLLAMLMGERFGVSKPLSVAGLTLLLSLLLLARVNDLLDYGLAACVFSFAFGLGIPYVVTAVADLDVDGRYVVLTVPALGIGIMTAPAVGGFLTGSFGYRGVLWAGGLAVLTALAFTLSALRLGLTKAHEMREQAGRKLQDPIL
ncbi:MAG TPA: MFS transporter [Xanthomonadales bacterium]|nr:MFS transporter [Xanthomonadales bacterium]